MPALFCGSVSAAPSTSNAASRTTSRARTASSDRPAGDQSASLRSRPSPHVTGCRPTRTKLGRAPSVCASTQASKAPVTENDPGPTTGSGVAPRSSTRASCKTTRASSGPRSASSPARERSTTRPWLF